MKKIILSLLTLAILSATPIFSVYGEDAPLSQTIIADGLPQGVMVTDGTAQTVPDPEDESNSVISFSASNEAVLWIPVDLTSGGVFELSYRIRWNDQSNNVMWLPMLSADKNPIFVPQHHQKGIVFSNNGSANYYRTYEENTWHTLKYVIDTEALTYSVYSGEKELKPYTGPNTGKYFSFTKAVLYDIDGVYLKIARGSVMLDDIKVTKIKESSSRTILFNSTYKVNHNDLTIGTYPYITEKDEVLSSLSLKDGVTAVVNTDEKYVKNGDTLTLYDSLYDKTMTYTLKLRTRNISKSFNALMNKSLILKENGDFCYIGGSKREGSFYNGETVKKEALNEFGINAAADMTISELENIGVFTQKKHNYLIIRKDAFSFFTPWLFDLEKLF